MISGVPDSQDLMPTKKATVYFTCQHEVKSALEQWAEEDGRSLSNLVERLVLAALEERQSSKPTKNSGTDESTINQK